MIIKPGYCKLDFLVPKTGLISKTIVFINKIDNTVKIAAYLYILLLPEDRNQEKVLRQMFYSCYEASTYTDWMKDFQNRKTRILVYTNVVGIGINIPNITWVI